MSDLISRQDAIDALKRYEEQCWEDACFKPLMSDARIIIGGLPSAEPEKRIKRHQSDFSDLEAEPERKTGKWIKKSNISPFYTVWWYECSECGQYPLKDVYNQESLTNYCPNCGCKMEDEK